MKIAQKITLSFLLSALSVFAISVQFFEITEVVPKLCECKCDVEYKVTEKIKFIETSKSVYFLNADSNPTIKFQYLKNETNDIFSQSRPNEYKFYLNQSVPIQYSIGTEYRFNPAVPKVAHCPKKQVFFNGTIDGDIFILNASKLENATVSKKLKPVLIHYLENELKKTKQPESLKKIKQDLLKLKKIKLQRILFCIEKDYNPMIRSELGNR